MKSEVGQGQAERQSSDPKNTCSQGSLTGQPESNGKQLRFEHAGDEARYPVIARLSAASMSGYADYNLTVQQRYHIPHDGPSQPFSTAGCEAVM